MARRSKALGTSARGTDLPRTWDKKRERQIIRTAARLFHRNGYADTSVQQVADAVGILKGSLYYWIDSKDDLLFRVMQEVHAESHKILEDVAAMDAPPLERLTSYLRRRVAYTTSHLTQVSVYYDDFARLSAPRRKIIVQQRLEFEHFVTGLIEEAQRDGTIRADLNPRAATFAALGMANWTYTWFRTKGDLTVDELADVIVTIATGGLRPDVVVPVAAPAARARRAPSVRRRAS